MYQIYLKYDNYRINYFVINPFANVELTNNKSHKNYCNNGFLTPGIVFHWHQSKHPSPPLAP